MLATATRRPVLVEQKDRRAARTPFTDVLLVNGEPMEARDISATGISVLLRTFAPGDIVRVTLAGKPGSAEEVATTARVSRVESSPDGLVVGLQFVE
jgi:hypothetical protein